MTTATSTESVPSPPQKLTDEQEHDEDDLGPFVPIEDDDCRLLEFDADDFLVDFEQDGAAAAAAAEDAFHHKEDDDTMTQGGKTRLSEQSKKRKEKSEEMGETMAEEEEERRPAKRRSLGSSGGSVGVSESLSCYPPPLASLASSVSLSSSSSASSTTTASSSSSSSSIDESLCSSYYPHGKCRMKMSLNASSVATITSSPLYAQMLKNLASSMLKTEETRQYFEQHPEALPVVQGPLPPYLEQAVSVAGAGQEEEEVATQGRVTESIGSGSDDNAAGVSSSNAHFLAQRQRQLAQSNASSGFFDGSRSTLTAGLEVSRRMVKGFTGTATAVPPQPLGWR